MKIFLYKTAAAVMLLALCPLRALCQEHPASWEFGIGGSLMNLTRTSVTDFHQTAGGDYLFTLEERLLYGGAEMYAAKELRKWLYADLQGTFGLARYYQSESLVRGWSAMAGPGLQFRPFTSSEWIQPFFRVGINWYRKTFPNSYFGQFQGDVTKEAVWKAEDAWNKGFTFDTDSFFPLSAGIGVVGWMSNRLGVRVQGQFLKSFGNKGANFAQASAGIIYRLGGNDKRLACAKDYPGLMIAGPAEVIKEVVKEVPVEVVREVVKEVPVEMTIAEMMDNVNFDFDKATITEDSRAILDEIADVLKRFPDEKFLVAGYTDSKGTDAYNDVLSEARANAVRNALIDRGVPASRLVSRGFGKRVAIVSSSASDEARRGDRKVVIERVTSELLWNYLIK